MTGLEEIYKNMMFLCQEIKQRNERLEALMDEAGKLILKNAEDQLAQKREPVHHVAVADPAKMQVITGQHPLAGTFPPNITKKA